MNPMDSVQYLDVLAKLGIGAVAIYFMFKLVIFIFTHFINIIKEITQNFSATLITVTENAREQHEKNTQLFEAGLASLRADAQQTQIINNANAEKFAKALEEMRVNSSCRFQRETDFPLKAS